MKDELRDPAFSAWVDLFRWLAALSVLITHVGIRMFVPVMEMPTRPAAMMAYAFVAGFDHYAVMVFFVISGLLVGGAAAREVTRTGTIALKSYILKRLVRLNIVLWPAFALAGVCAYLAILWGATGFGLLPGDSADSVSAGVLACNVAFLQTAACQQFAENGALWSLFNEFWYYVAFPPLALALFGRRSMAVRIGLVAVVVLMLAGLTRAQFTGSPIGPYMFIWLIGVWVAVRPRPLMRSPMVAALLLAMVLLAIRLLVRRTFATDHPLWSSGLDLVVSAAFGNMLLSMKCAGGLRLPPAGAKLHRTLAGFSFSLYCIHEPLLNLYVTLLIGALGWRWPIAAVGAPQLLALGGALALCIGAAWCFSRVTEAHTDSVRRWLLAAWAPRGVVPRG